MLEMRQVTKTFGGFKALDQLTLTVPRGAVYGVVGPNGAGKSTAIRHLCGVYRQDSGTVTLDGEPVYENPKQKARLGVIPDDVFFFPSASIQEMRRFYRGIYPTFDDSMFKKLGEAFDLPLNAQIRRFSKGMQKQAAFWLTVSCRPEVLILDEPVDGLDPVMRRQIWSIILADVAAREATVLISSHNLRELEDVCDHVGIMDKGHMLLEKSLADMQGNVMKLQMVGQPPAELEVLHSSTSGRLNTLIVRGTAEQIQAKVAPLDVPYFDVIPLSLEEIFIYELGGANYAVKEIVF